MSDTNPEPERLPADESAHMDKVDREPWGPTEDDETAVLRRHFHMDSRTHDYTYRVGD